MKQQLLLLTFFSLILTNVFAQHNSTAIGPENGTLIIVGGGKVPAEIWAKFIEAAGGEGANIVIIPTAMGDSSIKASKGYSSEKELLEKFGVAQVTVLHTTDPKEANTEAFVAPLKKATGIWFVGGRQWRLADSYLNTLAHKEFKNLLNRNGVAGDLFVHLLTNLHTITGSIGPNKIFALGELNYWKDGRDAYDLVTSLMQYPERKEHPAFQFFTRVNLADGGSSGSPAKIVGTEGVIEIGWGSLKVKNFKRPKAPEFGGYDSVNTFSQAQQEESTKAFNALYTEDDKKWNYGKEINFKVPQGYDERLDHFTNFFESVRTGKAVAEDATFGLRAAAPALACNMSAASGQPVLWDAEKMKVL